MPKYWVKSQRIGIPPLVSQSKTAHHFSSLLCHAEIVWVGVKGCLSVTFLVTETVANIVMQRLLHHTCKEQDAMLQGDPGFSSSYFLRVSWIYHHLQSSKTKANWGWLLTRNRSFQSHLAVWKGEGKPQDSCKNNKQWSVIMSEPCHCSGLLFIHNNHKVWDKAVMGILKGRCRTMLQSQQHVTTLGY